MDSEVLVAHHETDLALACLTTQLSAKIAEGGEVAAILDVGCRCLAVQDNRLVLHERPSSLVVAPDALRLREGSCAAEHAPEHFQCRVDPERLVDDGRSVPFDAWNEQDNEDTLASTAEDPPPLGKCLCSFLRHSDQYRSSHQQINGHEEGSQLHIPVLPERGVTVHSGHMGYTIGPFAGRAKCPGRSVTQWMNG
jgi:hypothetical protein